MSVATSDSVRRGDTESSQRRSALLSGCLPAIHLRLAVTLVEVRRLQGSRLARVFQTGEDMFSTT